MTAARDFVGPAHQRIAAEWAERIDSGELTDGHRLPTRPQLEEHYGVSRQVITQALALLHQQGYLYSEPSKGTFVRRLRMFELPMWSLESSGGLDAFDDAVRNQGGKPHQDIRVETALPGAEIAELLNLGTDELVTIRRRVRYIDGVPYATADSFFPHEIVRDTPISSPANITTGGRHVLRNMGYEMVRHVDKIRARRPHQTEMAILGVAPALSMITHTRVSFTATGKPIRVMLSVLPSDRWSIAYDVTNGER